jgi:hypothetical protein
MKLSFEGWNVNARDASQDQKAAPAAIAALTKRRKIVLRRRGCGETVPPTIFRPKM